MAGKDLKSIVDRIVDLPTLPQVVTTIMTLIEDPDSSASDINDVMTNDPALAGRILKLVNSVFYGLPNKVSSIQQAITILGFNTIKSLAISASVFDLFGEGDEGFSYEGFWKNSMGVATVARFLSNREPGVSPDTSFVVGLLHGMGKLVLDQYAPMEFQKILEVAQEKEIDFYKAEEEVIETTYAEIGYWLAERWQLAPDVQEVMKYQNRIADCPDKERPLAAVLAFARYVCKVKKYGSSGDFAKPQLSRAAWDSLHIQREQLPSVIAEINNELENAQAFLEIINS
ncbi:MAG: HDOD domain-containing protein [Planctomycetes bacterium]|nr:HDOD domain-containing protein [Planctomycetota bacterium]